MRETVLVLGSNGFIGGHLQEYVRAEGLDARYEFIGVDRVNAEARGIRCIQADLLKKENVAEVLSDCRPEYIINLAGTFDYRDKDLMIAVNAGISRDICETVLSEKIPVKRILLVGSAAEYGANDALPLNEETVLSPVNMYGLSKIIQTQYALYYRNTCGLPLNVARTFNVIGKNMPVTLSIGSFLRQIRDSGPEGTIQIGNVSTRRDFLAVSDVVNAFWRILMKGRPGEIYNVCSGHSHRIKDILDALIAHSGKRIAVSVREEYLRKNDVLDSYGDNAKLSRDTGWSPKKDVMNELPGLFL